MYKSAATALFSLMVALNPHPKKRGPASEMANPAPENEVVQADYTTAPKPKAAKKKATTSGQTGIASVYWDPQRIACGGGKFNPNGLTVAHRTLPCGTKLKVTNLANGRSVVVTVNDRGPFVHGRILDLARGAANAIGIKGGLHQVHFERVAQTKEKSI